MLQHKPIIHHVFFWLKKLSLEADEEQLIAGLKFFFVACVYLLNFSLDATGAPKLNPGRLTCEYHTNPLGIDDLTPRLSWTLVATGRSQRQTAYEILVSDNKNDISNLRGNMWKTGRVLSDQSLHIEYGGKPLKSFTRYFWRVRVYDRDGKASSWSRPQWFETAILYPGDWKAQWIGDGRPQAAKDEDFYQDDPMPLFRKAFDIKKQLTSARLYISGLGYYEASIDGKRVGDRVLDPGWTNYSKQVLYSVYDVTPSLHPGENVIGVMLGNGWYNPLPLIPRRKYGCRPATAAILQKAADRLKRSRVSVCRK